MMNRPSATPVVGPVHINYAWKRRAMAPSASPDSLGGVVVTRERSMVAGDLAPPAQARRCDALRLRITCLSPLYPSQSEPRALLCVWKGPARLNPASVRRLAARSATPHLRRRLSRPRAASIANYITRWQESKHHIGRPSGDSEIALGGFRRRLAARAGRPRTQVRRRPKTSAQRRNDAKKQ